MASWHPPLPGDLDNNSPLETTELVSNCRSSVSTCVNIVFKHSPSVDEIQEQAVYFYKQAHSTLNRVPLEEENDIMRDLALMQPAPPAPATGYGTLLSALKRIRTVVLNLQVEAAQVMLEHASNETRDLGDREKKATAERSKARNTKKKLAAKMAKAARDAAAETALEAAAVAQAAAEAAPGAARICSSPEFELSIAQVALQRAKLRETRARDELKRIKTQRWKSSQKQIGVSDGPLLLTDMDDFFVTMVKGKPADKNKILVFCANKNYLPKQHNRFFYVAASDLYVCELVDFYEEIVAVHDISPELPFEAQTSYDQFRRRPSFSNAKRKAKQFERLGNRCNGTSSVFGEGELDADIVMLFSLQYAKCEKFCLSYLDTLPPCDTCTFAMIHAAKLPALARFGPYKVHCMFGKWAHWKPGRTRLWRQCILEPHDGTREAELRA